MNSEKWHSVTLRLVSSQLTCAQLTERIGVKPTRCEDIGSPVSKRTPNSALRVETIWLISSTVPEREPLENHLLEIVAIAEAHIETIRTLPCEADIICAISSTIGQASALIDASLCRRIADLGWDILLNMFPPSSETAVNQCNGQRETCDIVF